MALYRRDIRGTLIERSQMGVFFKKVGIIQAITASRSVGRNLFEQTRFFFTSSLEHGLGAFLAHGHGVARERLDSASRWAHLAQPAVVLVGGRVCQRQ